MPQTKKDKTTNKDRDKSLDLLKGIAVILMIITHVYGIFYSGNSQIIDLFVWLGATVCFTTFLFASASVIGILIEKEKLNKRKLLNRTLNLFFWYFITSYILIGLKYGFAISIEQIIEILSFGTVPEFVEFLIPFIVFSLIIIAIPTKYLKSFLSPYFLAPLVVILYTVGKLLYLVEIEVEIFTTLKYILSGQRELHAFGVLSYLPVFAFGLWWGSEKIRNPEKIKEKSLYSIVFFTISFVILVSTGFSDGTRFPPSLAFLSFGLAFSMIVLLLSNAFSKIKLLSKPVIFLGENTFTVYILHIIILYLIAFYMDWQTFGALISSIILILTISSTYLLVYTYKTLR